MREAKVEPGKGRSPAWCQEREHWPRSFQVRPLGPAAPADVQGAGWEELVSFLVLTLAPYSF